MRHRRPKDPKPWFPAPDRPPRLLIVRLSALGDVLHALPVLSALRFRFPRARIDWVVEDRAADLLRTRRDLDRVVVFPRRRLRCAVRGLPRPIDLLRTAGGFVREMRSGGYDVALDLQGNLKSGVVTRLSGAALRFGFDRRAVREGNQLFTHRRALPPSRLRHRVDRNLALASALIGEPLPYVPPGFPTLPEHARAARALIAQAGLPPSGFALLHPGTSGFGLFKRWPCERFAALAQRLVDDGLTVAVTHAPEEASLAEELVARAGPAVAVLPTPDLLVLAEVIRGARVFVAGDTGPLHLAALVGTPLLGLYGPKDPDVYGPYGIDVEGRPGRLPVLTQDDVACRPCALRQCADPLCLQTLAPERVYWAVRELLGNPA